MNGVNKLRLKACPRCRGDMGYTTECEGRVETDVWTCLQCGFPLEGESRRIESSFHPAQLRKLMSIVDD